MSGKEYQTYKNMKTLIITHWDTDGVISAAVLAQSLGKADFFVPKIGMYSITDEDIKKINLRKYDEIYVVDFACQKKTVEKLKCKKIQVIDHHFSEKAKNVKYFNPILKGASYDDYPCTVQVLCEYLGKDYLLESCIGAVGDKEQNILKNEKFRNKIRQCRTGFNKMYLVKNLIDSSYMLNKRKEIIRTIRLIMEKGVLAVLKDRKLKEQLRFIDREKKRLMKTMPEKISNKILLYRLKSKYELVSTITRQLSKKYPDKIIVTKLGSTIYVRRDKAKTDLKKLIDYCRSKGWQAGGKHEVCGITNADNKILKEVIELLNELVLPQIIQNFLD
jgi:single-stranded DNA-specific DHH superfamily exonuclease